MPEEYQVAQRDERGRAVGFKGKQAGKDFATTAELEGRRKRQAFDTAMGWAGIGGAAKKPRGKEYEDRFSAWDAEQSAREAAAGQKKAVTKAP